MTRTISIQMAPQIRLIQNGDTLMAEKIQSTINNTIPLWKNQMVLALGLAHSKAAVEAQREVSDLTNELLKKNAEALKTGTVAIAEESERSIVYIETVRYTNEQLISTLDEVMQIQKEGAQKRQEAETELRRIESELKAYLQYRSIVCRKFADIDHLIGDNKLWNEIYSIFRTLKEEHKLSILPTCVYR